ncbi:class I SAM-dependent methyltransferase [Shimia sp.]|uniref:class I SAM-dependent methyltransferase n=1 Tax=Shimia sp. TaxID=1954381 RepID=UPI0032979D84
MTFDYNKLYGETSNALGDPTPILVEFFDRFPHGKARVLDVGCGQGRDALFIARLGHEVVGVDISPNGIRDLLAVAKREGLTIEGVVADVSNFVPEGDFDVVLIDRTLHMLSEPVRLAVLKTMLGHVCPRGWLLIADEVSNIEAFEKVISRDSAQWQTTHKNRGYLFVQRS